MTFYLQKAGTYLGNAYLFLLDVSKGEVIVGRETHPLLHKLTYVSERHAAFGRIESGEWYIIDISEHRTTFLNGFRLDSNVRYLLRPRDRIGFSTNRPDRNYLSICFDFCVRPPTEEMRGKPLIDDLEDRMWSMSQRIPLDSNGLKEPHSIQNNDPKILNQSKSEPEKKEICCPIGKSSVPLDNTDIWNNWVATAGPSGVNTFKKVECSSGTGHGNPFRGSRNKKRSRPYPQ